MTAALDYFWWPAALIFLVVALAGIWLRGYLVSGTPELTWRYFPGWLRVRFDKGPLRIDTRGVGPDDPADLLDNDPERTLLEAGVVELAGT